MESSIPGAPCPNNLFFLPLSPHVPPSAKIKGQRTSQNTHSPNCSARLPGWRKSACERLCRKPLTDFPASSQVFGHLSPVSWQLPSSLGLDLIPDWRALTRCIVTSSGLASSSRNPPDLWLMKILVRGKLH